MERALAPLIIGITGKRDLKGKDDAIRAGLREAFDCLDRHFGNTPKILLTALAEGVDTLAAEEALRRAEQHHPGDPPGRRWEAVAVLPLTLDLYLQDFDSAGAARLSELCATMRTLVLPPLRRPQPGQPFAPGPPFAANELVRGAGGNPDRAAHYEQVGMHIADQCGLLIAVMERDETPDKVGGTARILAYRVGGELDAAGRDIARRSQLLARLPLDRPQPGPAWVIDLTALDAAGGSPLGAIELWEPTPREGPARPHDAAGIRKTRLTDMRHAFASLWLATAFDRFNAEALHLDDSEWTREVESKAGNDAGDASSKLRRLRLALSLIQVRKKQTLTRITRWLAALFVIAIIALEVRIEFKLAEALYAYVALFLAILAIYAFGRGRHFQQRAEDYRAVAEAARVQLAWWDAGLSGHEDRVDRTYLGGTAGSLGRVRAAVRHLIDSVMLTAHAPIPTPGAESRWIEGQIGFFRKRIEERHSSLSFVEDAAWFLFIGSLGMALFLALLELRKKDTIFTVEQLLAWLSPYGALLVGLEALGGLFFLRQPLSWVARKAPFSRTAALFAGLVGLLAAVAAGFVLSIGFHQVAIMGAKWGIMPHAPPSIPQAHSVEQFLERLALVTMIGVAALAGAMRYFVEKLSREHELFSYRDALVVFERAHEDLAELRGDGSPAAQTRRREILQSIGREALEENEAWIRAHRLRPLEPIVGG